MRSILVLTAAVTLLGLGGVAQADVFNLGPGLTNLETVTVGDPGNAADTRYATPGFGSVAYTYNIGRFEVTQAQYADFLNKVAKADPYGLYNVYMGGRQSNIVRTGGAGSYSYTVASNWANKPVDIVSYWNACRFVNWLHNGQPTGQQDATTTEDGAYAINGYNGNDGREITRKPGAGWFIPTEDEWYKAAYYKGGGKDAGYWDYPTQSDSVPSALVVDPDPGNNANCGFGNDYYPTDVGEFENSGSPYGTFDQGGNVWEMTETIREVGVDWASFARRGGSSGLPEYTLHASSGNSFTNPGDPHACVGFRVAAAVAEPVLLIVIDIRPGSDQNNINLRSRGVVPVAVLTTDEFDAGSVDPAACRFAGASPLRWAMQDVNRDGHKDLIMHFDTQQLNLSANAVTATLTGETWDGQTVEGTDNVRIVPPAR